MLTSVMYNKFVTRDSSKKIEVSYYEYRKIIGSTQSSQIL